MRVKEDADDYRYFREPDLVDLAPDQSWQDRIRAGLLPMPAERRQKLAALLSDLSVAHLDAVEVVINLGLDDLVMRAVDGGVDVTLAISRAANELAANIDEVKNFSSESFTATLLMEQQGELSATQAKTVLTELLTHGGDPHDVAKKMGFEQLSASSLGATVAALIEEHPEEWTRYRDGDEKLEQFFIGQVMKFTKGQANGKSVVAELQARR
jgi:aspartyl-tRNA(Asn)/glutamyl-tRNA(Gln) amidotransferase subunit B